MKIETIKQAITSLKQGHLLAYPTESMYGIGTDPYNNQAVESLKDLKERGTKGFILIASAWVQVADWVDLPKRNLLSKALKSWPGPVTWIMPASKQAPKAIIGPNNTLAIRIPDHPICQQLCQSFGGAIISTSANPKGEEPAKNHQAVANYFKHVDILIGDIGNRTKPSTVKNILTNEIYRH